MSVIIEITNTQNLERAKKLLGTKTDGETLELALEKVIEEYEPKTSENEARELTDEFFEDLFAEESVLTDGETIRAVLADREESLY